MGVKSFAAQALRTGVGTVRSVGGFALRGGGSMTWNAMKGMGTFWRLKDYRKQGKIIGVMGRQMLRGKGVDTARLIKAGKASANLLGKGAGFTMTARMLGGRSPIRDKKGKVNIPFIPFV